MRAGAGGSGTARPTDTRGLQQAGWHGLPRTFGQFGPTSQSPSSVPAFFAQGPVFGVGPHGQLSPRTFSHTPRVTRRLPHMLWASSYKNRLGFISSEGQNPAGY